MWSYVEWEGHVYLAWKEGEDEDSVASGHSVLPYPWSALLDNGHLAKRGVEQEELMECAHHWLIEPPSGPMSKGVCKLCGAEKEFLNNLPEFDKNYDYEARRQTDLVLVGQRGQSIW